MVSHTSAQDEFDQCVLLPSAVPAEVAPLHAVVAQRQVKLAVPDGQTG